jgi:hypothetical protein
MGQRGLDRNVEEVGMSVSKGVVAAAVAWVPWIAACDAGLGPRDIHTITFDFAAETHGWTAGFADYPPEWESGMELVSGHEPLPEALGVAGRGLFIGGMNLSDDLFMFWKGRATGLEPQQRYQVRFKVEFASQKPSGCAGVGGAPGESVFVKAGATAVEPVVSAIENGMGDVTYYRLNIDKSDQAGSGEDAIVIGDAGTTNPDCFDWRWELKTLVSGGPFEVTTDADGAVWLLVGTDSGFEGRSEFYYTRFEAEFTAR